MLSKVNRLSTILKKWPYTGHGGSIKTIRQRFYLIKQGLDTRRRYIVFNSLIISNLTHACQVFSVFLAEYDLNRLQSCLNKAYRWKLFSVQYDIGLNDMFKQSDEWSFHQVMPNSCNNCLHRFLPTLGDSHAW